MLHREAVARATGDALGRVASRVRRLAGRDPIHGWGELAVGFRAQTIELVRDRWLPLLAAEIVSQLSVFLVLLVSARFLGISNDQATWAQVLAVFAFVRLATAMPVIPGNVGLAELGYIGGLVLAGAPKTEAVAAVLVFRFLTYFVQIPVGGLTYVVWRRNRGWRRGGPQAVGDDPPQEAAEVRDGEGGQGQPGLVQDGRGGHQQQPYVATPQ
jgi:putative heme transporter